MRQKFLFFMFILFCTSFLFAVNLDIPLKNFEVSGVSVDRITLESEAKKVTVFITVPEKYLADFDDIKLEELSRLYTNLLIQLNIKFRHLHIFLRTSESGEYKRASEFLPKLPPVPKKEDGYEGGASKSAKKSLLPQVRHGNVTGALNGKTLFVSAGHGWVYNTKTSGWVTQRGITQGMREDDSNAEIVSYFLIPYLQNAGGTVFSVRERDRQENMVIIDEADDTAYETQDGIYEESGNWTTSDSTGYGRRVYPIERGVNPMVSGGYRYANAEIGAWARWTANIPEDGFYHIYVSYRAGTNRTDSAVYTVKHAGGSTEVRVNQQHHGSTWIDLGKFYFRAGLSRENGSVTLSGTDDIIIADAVRFGGGTGLIKRGGSTSDKPRWEEAATHNIQFMGGANGETYGLSSNDRDDDVRARSRWAAWENETNDDSLYIAFHSNAPCDTCDPDKYDGLSTYTYNNNPAAGSEDLAEFVHYRILNSVKSLFDDTYKEIGNGLLSGDYGEINPDCNNEMPSIIVELAFHTSPVDSARLKNPKYRDIASRAAYQGIVQYFAQKDGTEAVFLPGSPRNLRTKVNENGSVTLSWSAPESDSPNYYKGHPATGYYVQTSTDGNAFNDGTDVGNVLQFTKNFELDKPVYFRVVAYNAGGVSFPSAVAAAVPAKHGAQILLVDGFERIDNYMARFNEGDNNNHRYILEYINSFDYAKYYVPLISELGYSLDFTQRTNVTGMDLSKYDMIVWFSGEQSTADETFKADEQTKITEYIADGGAFFVSGAEIGWDLQGQKNATDNDKKFLNEILNVNYIKDESKLYTFYGIEEFLTISGDFDDGTYVYQAEYADVLSPYARSGRTVLFYDSAKTLGAGILTKTDAKKVFVLGFPFETILEKDNKIELLQFALDEFGITPKTDDDPSDSGIETPDEDSDDDTADSNDEAPDEDADSDSGDSGETSDEDDADSGNEPADDEQTDSESEPVDEDSADSADSTDTSDTADSSDTSSENSGDTCDVTDSEDTNQGDSGEADSENHDENSGNGGSSDGCSVLLL